MTIQEIVNKFNISEKIELLKSLQKELKHLPQLDKTKNVQINEIKPICPHCQSIEICGHGRHKGRKRYKCKECKRTFNELTGTAVSGLKKQEKFQEYLILVVESPTIRIAARKLGVSTKTIFDWRHKLLSSFNTINK